jgi:hypothetical protein
MRTIIKKHIPMPQYCNIFKLVIIYLMKESTEEESNERGKERMIYMVKYGYVFYLRYAPVG